MVHGEKVGDNSYKVCVTAMVKLFHRGGGGVPGVGKTPLPVCGDVGFFSRVNMRIPSTSGQGESANEDSGLMVTRSTRPSVADHLQRPSNRGERM